MDILVGPVVFPSSPALHFSSSVLFCSAPSCPQLLPVPAIICLQKTDLDEMLM